MGKINACDKIMFDNQKKRENMEIKKYLHETQSKTWFWYGIHSELTPEEALTSFTVSDAYR